MCIPFLNPLLHNHISQPKFTFPIQEPSSSTIFSFKDNKVASKNNKDEGTSTATEKMEVAEDPSNKKNTKPTVLLFQGTNRKDQFEITHPIGKSNNGLVQVYKAISSSSSIPNEDTSPIVSYVAVKCVNRDYQPQAVRNLTTDVCRSILIPYHRNIIGITKNFNYKTYYCVVFPLMGNSLRSIMHTRFSKGFPEECIVVALKEILTAISFIYKHGDVDLQINAGNIFFTGKEIKLAFSASTYECQDHNQSSSSSSSPQSYMPMSSICKWAVPPEYPSELFKHKRDIWMIGITALELAYGGLWVSSKADLQKRLYTIEMCKKRLPDCWINKKEIGIKMLRSLLFKERNFSRDFQKMVISCLSSQAYYRPTIQELLESEVFAKCKKDVNYFCRLVGE
ncbi:hypothetical protein BUALT_Bualt16G0052800 [Buddleja alternifolia]|uniref:Protein kinase domain-containing protein n=1 Tax=Buddleja alternifolia TaxID=168488 RepID=A0AAV6WAT3_9LAMI|nr:hypothetical protein BUALT_Bualt16G0052800 [Buddleja alternifolia]